MIGLLALTLTDIDLLPYNPARYHQALVNLLNLTKSVAPVSINFSTFITKLYHIFIIFISSILASLENAIGEFKTIADQFNQRVQTGLDKSK